ncbi:kinase-like protein [Coemansia reversa NRRL 1564]|uniref:non-specific serine/threonine protein kinase n=1 Tax=Coemansia reversa (strain ATCC 12441 / NRRL 1564) TaxID=763665 RepID=A0A2G5B2J3_COERN|nr:kinase-like protein [Coemansia reversa NRRL 1564]|eukprot:PIA13215.1 kinase-like protein [Coemansia reversa NRRL 1564]
MTDNDSNSSGVSQRQRATVVIGDYELGAQIGRGSFATVYKGVNKRTNMMVAVKSVIRSSLTRRLLENLETEINILRAVKYQSIVELIDCLKSRNHIHLVMEYCSLGDLAGYMRKSRDHQVLRNNYGGLNMNIARSFVRQLGTAMRFLRLHNIIHRDIKTQNILLQPPPTEDYVMGESEARGMIPCIKVADFGFARSLPSTALAETLCGSPLYMAPEILHYKPYGPEADLWSIGAVTYEIMTGKPPFHASNHVELARVIERTNDNIVFPDEKRPVNTDAKNELLSLDPVLKDLVRRLLKMKPDDRIQFSDFFEHPALEGCLDEVIPSPPLRTYNYDDQTVPANELSAESTARTLPISTESPRLDSNRSRRPYNYAQQTLTTTARAHAAGPHRDHAADNWDPLDRAAGDTTEYYALSAAEGRNEDERRMVNAMNGVYIGDQMQQYDHRRHQDMAPGATEARGTQQRHLMYPPSPQDRRQLQRQRHGQYNARPADIAEYYDEAASPDGTGRKRRGSLTEEEQALAEREYVVVEKRAVEMNVLADELESSPRMPLAFYPPRAGAINQAPNVARQMTALARAIHSAVSPQYNISNEAANGPLNSHSADVTGGRRTTHSTFNPLDAALADTFESRHSQGTTQEDPTIRRMEGLAYKAYALSYLADMKWRQLPNTPTSRDPLAQPDSSFLNTSDVTIEDAFVLYLRALSLLHRAMVDASHYWISIHSPNVNDTRSPNIQLTTRTSDINAASSSVTVSAAFNGAVQWVRNRFNECLERAEALKQLTRGNELDNVAHVSIVRILYEQSLALSREAAVRELKWMDPLDCDRAYQLAIWMLSAILETAATSVASSTTSSTSSSSSHRDGRQRAVDSLKDDQEKMDPEDRTIVERFIASIVKRREALQRRLMKDDLNI